MSLACQQRWPLNKTAAHLFNTGRQGLCNCIIKERRDDQNICATAIFSYIKTSRRAFLNRHEVNLFEQNKRKHGRLCAAVQYMGGQTSSFTCVYTYQRLLQQDTGLLLVLHWESHFCAHQGHFFSLALTHIFAGALARTMAAARFCQLHIAADHRDMQRPWINYFMGNSTTAAETFWTGKPTVESWYCCIPNSKMERPVCHLCFTISVQIKSSENSCKIPMVVSPSYRGFHLCYLGVSRHLRRGTSSRVVGRRAFGRFWDGQRRSMWDGFAHRLDLPNCVFWDRLPTSKLAKIGIMLVRIVQLPRKVKCILKSVTLWAHSICGKFNPVTK